MTTPEAEPQNGAAPSEPPAHQPAPPSPDPQPAAETLPAEPSLLTEGFEAPVPAPDVVDSTRPITTVRAAQPGERELVYVPLAVNVGDGFKFGCGFFLAMVLALLVGFVVVAALFVLTGLFGLNLPLTR